MTTNGTVVWRRRWTVSDELKARTISLIGPAGIAGDLGRAAAEIGVDEDDEGRQDEDRLDPAQDGSEDGVDLLRHALDVDPLDRRPAHDVEDGEGRREDDDRGDERCGTLTGMKFRTVLLQNSKTATGIQVPDEVMTALNAGKAPKVPVTMNGYTYRSSVAT